MGTINEINGDLFTCDEDVSLVHCVSRCFNMGAGIAVLFKQKFGNVDNLLAQNTHIGGVAYINLNNVIKTVPNKNQNNISNGRFVYYMVTKDKYYMKPTYGSLKLCLVELKRLLIMHGITKIAMPRIGCGLDKLKWTKVKTLISDTFANTNIDITIYYI